MGLNEIIKKIYAENMKKVGVIYECLLNICHFYHFFNHLIKNPQTTIALTFLTHIISSIGGVVQKCQKI